MPYQVEGLVITISQVLVLPGKMLDFNVFQEDTIWLQLHL